MGRSPPPVAGRCPRLAANTGAVFVDGDLEVRFAARATNGSEGSHTRATNCILLRPAPRGQGDRGRPRRRTVLRRAAHVAHRFEDISADSSGCCSTGRG